jgi:hypothetical protein
MEYPIGSPFATAFMTQGFGNNDTQGQMQSYMKQFQTAQDKANAANEKRYQQGLAALQQSLTQSQGLYQQAAGGGAATPYTPGGAGSVVGTFKQPGAGPSSAGLPRPTNTYTGSVAPVTKAPAGALGRGVGGGGTSLPSGGGGGGGGIDFGQAQTQSQALYQQALGASQGAGQSAMADINAGAKQAYAQGLQHLTGAGLGNTSLGANLSRGVESDRARGVQRVQEGVGLQQAGIYQNQAGSLLSGAGQAAGLGLNYAQLAQAQQAQQAGILQNQAQASMQGAGMLSNFIGARSDQGPDMSLYASLLQGLGLGGR